MGLLGRALALTGIITGLLAFGLPFAAGSRYVDDGTLAACLLVLLSLASWLPAEIGWERFGAVAGAGAFGLFLNVPASAAFDKLGFLHSGAWLGLCTLLIPIGALVMWAAHGPVRTRATPPSRETVGLPLAAAGLVLIVVGIWLDALDGGPTYWNLSASGHAVGILMLLLVALNVLLLAGPLVVSVPSLRSLDLIVAALTCGFVEFAPVASAFETIGDLGAGAWIEACAGALLLAGVLRLQFSTAAAASSPAAMPSPASAP